MYKKEKFFDEDEMLVWLNQNKLIEVAGIINVYGMVCVIYFEPEPQPQQKDLIPESDKKESL